MNKTFTFDHDLTINRLGFGAMRITGDGVWGDPPDRAKAIAVLHRAIELGVNFIDTADAYGPETSENLIAEALKPYPADLVIATKGGMVRSGPNQWAADGSPDHLREAINGSLERMGLDRIDLYQLHSPDAKVPFRDSVTTLKELQDLGKIRYIGLSNVSVEQLEEARSIVEIVSVQNHYNVSNRSSEDVLKACEEHGIAFLPYFPLGGGMGDNANLVADDGPLAEIAARHEATPHQVALAWLLQHSEVMVPIPGTGSVDHLEDNMKAAELTLTDEDMAELNTLGS